MMHGPTHIKIILQFGSCAQPTWSSSYKPGSRIKCYTGLQTCLIPLMVVINILRVGGVKCEIFIQEMREYQFIFPPGTCSLQTHNLYTLKSAKWSKFMRKYYCWKPGDIYQGLLLSINRNDFFLAKVNTAIPTETCLPLLFLTAVLCSYLKLQQTLVDKVYMERGVLISKFHCALNVVCFLLGKSPASEIYMPTFRNTLSGPSS